MNFRGTDIRVCKRRRRSLYALTGGLAAWCILTLASCHISPPPEECGYNLQLRYRYFREMSDTRSVADTYIKNIDEYVFDGEGVLFEMRKLPGNSCEGRLVSESTLPDGKYTVVAVGNMNGYNRMPEATPGVTTLGEMMMHMHNPVGLDEGTATHGDSDRLYYGYTTFTVGGLQAKRLNVDMFHSHCVLSVTVRWRNGVPENMTGLRMLYRQIPGGYTFTPGYVLDGDVWSRHIPGTDSYSAAPDDKKCYVPGHFPDRAMVTHEKSVAVNVDKKIETQFITYRYTSDSPLLISLHSAEGQVMKEIDLQRFFREMGIDLDRNYRQEFAVQFEIDGDNVYVGFVSVSDWEEGGVIGGK